MHVVQIWIMHINALKTHLMHKNVQMNPEKSQKITQHSCCSMLTREKNWKQLEAMDIVSSPKLGRSLRKPSCLLWEAPICKKLIPKFVPIRPILLPQHGSTMTWHQCQVSWFSDVFWIYKNLEARYLNVCGWVPVAGCLTFIPISCMGPKHAPKDKDLIFQPIYMHWSMRM